jgi:diguanylate cyclase (GGDEF)-like protein
MKTDNNNNVFSIMILGPIFVIPTVAILLLLLMLQKEEADYKRSLSTLEQSVLEKNKKRIAHKVKNTSDLIKFEQSLIQDDLHQRIKQRVDDAKKIALNLHDRHHKTLSEKQLQRIIIDALRPLVWNKGESFIWILDFDGIFYLAPEYLRHLEGSSIIDFKDATGREVIKEEIELCQSSGKGFLWDTFTKPNGDPNKQYKQLAYVTAFGHYNWYLGSSEYLDTAIKKTDALLLKKISTISSQNNEHIFIINHAGDILLHPLEPALEGQNMYVSKDPHMAEVVPVFEGVLKNKVNGFISYEWHHPYSKKLERKTTFVEHIKGTDWLIGSGFFQSDIVELVHAEQEKIALQKSERKENLLSIGALLIVLSFILSFLISIWVKKKFYIYEKKINRNNTELTELNELLEKKVKERTKKLEAINTQLEKLATTDALTQIHNRYFFMECIDAEVKRFYRYNSVFSLIMFDLDYFKQINDKYGHQKGDEVLIAVSRLVESSLRDTDTLFRFGGEEFMVILPETDLNKAYEIADRMRLLVEENDFGLQLKTTISIGVVAFKEGDTVDSIISKVDTLLYHSKDEGRNSISKADA